MNFDYHNYKINRLLMSTCGVWPYKHSKLANFHRCFVVLSVISIIVPQIVKVYLSEFNMTLFACLTSSVGTVFGFMMKYCTSWFNRELIKDLLDEIQESWKTITIKDEAAILREYAKRGKQFGLIILMTMGMAHCSFFSISLIETFLDVVAPLNETRAHTLPFEAEYLVDEKKYFYAILLHMQVASFLMFNSLIAGDMIYSTIVFHACGNFSIVGYQLKHMFDDCSKKSRDSNNNFTCLERLVRAVRSHRKALKYAELINSCYGLSYVLQQATSVILFVITFFGLHLALLARDIENAIMFAAHFAGVVAVIFLNIIPAQALIDHSDDIFRQVYNGHWYTAPVKSQRLVLSIMRRSMNPCKISAFNFMESSFQTFCLIIRTSLSYFAVLCSMQ